MEIYNKLKPLLVGGLLIAIAVMFITSIFKRDFGKFLPQVVMCGVAYMFVDDPQSLVNILYVVKNILMDLLGKGV